MTYGLTGSGWVSPTLYDIRKDIENQILTTISPHANLLPESVFSKLTGIFAQGITDVWEAAEALHNAHTINAEGAALDRIGVFSGKFRKAAQKAVIRNAGVSTSGACTIPAGTQCTITGTDLVFEFTGEQNFATAGIYQTVNLYCTVAGSQTIANLGTFEFSPVVNLSVIVWDTALGSLIFQGSDAEDDEAFRSRIQSQSTAKNYNNGAISNAIMALNDNKDVLGIDTILSCNIFENVDAVTVSGRPAHSIEVVVYYGGTDSQTDATIAATIAQTLADGVGTCTTTGSFYSSEVTIREGTTRSITFSKPAEKNIYLGIITTPAISGSTATALKSDIANAMNELLPGDDVILYGKKSISTVLNAFAGSELTSYTITAKIGGAPSGGDTSNITINYDEVARFSTSNITINGA